MAPQVPYGIPSTLIPGLTWQWTQQYGDFPPSDGWTLQYKFTGATSFSIDATPRTDTEDYAITVDAATTITKAAGLYRYLVTATLAGVVWPAEEGTIEILPSPFPTDGSDARTYNEKMLVAIQTELQARVTGDGSGHDALSIAAGSSSRAITKIPTEKLEAMLARFLVAVQRERNGGVLPPYEATFGRPL